MKLNPSLTNGNNTSVETQPELNTGTLRQAITIEIPAAVDLSSTPTERLIKLERKYQPVINQSLAKVQKAVEKFENYIDNVDSEIMIKYGEYDRFPSKSHGFTIKTVYHHNSTDIIQNTIQEEGLQFYKMMGTLMPGGSVNVAFYPVDGLQDCKDSMMAAAKRDITGRAAKARQNAQAAIDEHNKLLANIKAEIKALPKFSDQLKPIQSVVKTEEVE